VWSASAVAHRLGVAPATLRSWNQRYQLGPAGHQRGRHRRYTAQDVAVLETMCRLIADGVVPAAAARIAQSQLAANPTPDDPVDVDVDVGRASPVEAPGRVALGLVQAALRLDADTLTRTLDHQLRTHGVAATWNQVCVPALTAVGRRVTPAGDCVDAEHLLSWTIIAALHRTPLAAPTSHRRVLLACADGERHSLGLEALHAALTTSGIPARMLGATVPATVLAAAADRIGPAAVVVWAQVSRTARLGGLRLLDATAQRVIAAGPGWRLARLPPNVVRADSLATAVGLLRDAVTIDATPRAKSHSTDRDGPRARARCP